MGIPSNITLPEVEKAYREAFFNQEKDRMSLLKTMLKVVFTQRELETQIPTLTTTKWVLYGSLFSIETHFLTVSKIQINL